MIGIRCVTAHDPHLHDLLADLRAAGIPARYGSQHDVAGVCFSWIEYPG